MDGFGEGRPLLDGPAGIKGWGRNTALLVLALGIGIAPTPVGQGIFNGIGQLVRGISQAGS
ncbi:hypothetical protein [Streptomyces sp. NPDC003943]